MILLIAFMLLIVGVFVVTYYQAPVLAQRADQWQTKRSQTSSRQLENAFMFVSTKKLRYIYIAAPIVLGTTGFFLFKTIGAVMGILLGVIIPVVIVKMLIAKRRKKFESQTIDTMMIISSCLKGGLSLIQSFETVVEEMPPPVSEEYGLVVRETKVGVSLEESLLKFNERMRSEDMDLIISSILVARETGGDLTKVFSRLIGTIRDRQEIKEMAETLTLQGRMQGIIMSMIPPVFVMMIFKFNPHHFDVMTQNEIGRILIIAAVIMQILAFFFIKRFSTVKV